VEPHPGAATDQRQCPHDQVVVGGRGLDPVAHDGDRAAGLVDLELVRQVE
jgi:hypothetical protein